MENNPIILFDGVCNFCNNAVNFVIKRDKHAQIKFSVLQSEYAKKLMVQHGLITFSLDTFIFIDKGRLYQRSTAALKVCKYLNGLWPLCYGFIIVPTFMRDALYKLISRNRYRWFGKKDQCMVPTPELKQRFIDIDI